MKFTVYRTSEMLEDEKHRVIEINTIEDLQHLYEEYDDFSTFKEGMIINFNDKTIEIYDTYRE